MKEEDCSSIARLTLAPVPSARLSIGWLAKQEKRKWEPAGYSCPLPSLLQILKIKTT